MLSPFFKLFQGALKPEGLPSSQIHLKGKKTTKPPHIAASTCLEQSVLLQSQTHQLLPLLDGCFLALQHRPYQPALAGFFISFPPFPKLFESNYQPRKVVKCSVRTQEGPKLSDLLKKHQHLYAMCSEGRQAAANQCRLPGPMVSASWEADTLTCHIHSVFLKAVCAAELPVSGVRLWELGPGPLTNPQRTVWLRNCSKYTGMVAAKAPANTHANRAQQP